MFIADLSLIWITARAAGVVALVASSASVILGLALAGRVGAGQRRGFLGDVRVLHQTLGIATIVALAVHVATLLLDPWLEPSLVELAVPFLMGYQPVWTGLGIIAGYGLLVLGVSGFLRGRAGTRWKVVHRFAGLTWALSVAHSLGAGTDAGALWLQLVTALCVAPVVVLVALRVARSYGNQIGQQKGAADELTSSLR